MGEGEATVGSAAGEGEATTGEGWELERLDSVPGLFGLLDLANFWTVASG